MEQLFLDGYYHGNFSLENTYCFLECSTPVVKLTNFRKKGNIQLTSFIFSYFFVSCFSLDAF